MRKLFESFLQKLVLLLFEDVRNIELLKLLIGKVYKELFKRVDAEYLKAKYI